jgi:hypothetical protein
VARGILSHLGKPKWSLWLQYADVTLQQAVALSCDWDPEKANAAELVPSIYNDRYVIAENHSRAGRLKEVRIAQYTLQEFARWATDMGWDLPKEFPKTKPIVAPPVPPPKSAKTISGVTITLPFVSKGLAAVFEVLRAHWTKYDRKQPPKQANVAAAIDKALGWHSKPDGFPSRNASALAALIKPDEVAESDRRGRKR